MRRGGLWVCNIAWRDKGTMRRLRKNASMVYEEIKERACVHSSWLAKPLGVQIRYFAMLVFIIYYIICCSIL